MYGSHANRVPARGAGVLTDVNIYKIGIVGRTERGFEQVIQKEIYNWDDFSKKCGEYGDGSDYIGYVTASFLKELNSQNPVELKVLGYVASDAVQADYDMLDQDATPEAAFTASAGRRNVDDKSAFGNKIALKVTTVENITMKLGADTGATPASAVLDDVSNLEVGQYVRFDDDTNSETAIILTITVATKTITFAALTNAYTAALTTVYRQDVDLRVAVKDVKGNYDPKETWIEPMMASDSDGIAGAVNNEDSGSHYIKLAYNSGTATPAAEDQLPAELTDWTPLTSGSDGTDPGDSDYDTLVNTYFTDHDIAILLAPESTSITHNSNMITWATDNYKCMYYAQASNGANSDTLKNFGGSLKGGIKFGMIPSDKWIEVSDPVTDGKKQIPKVGIDAAHWFNTYAKYGESKVAAGNKPEMVLGTQDKLLDSNGLVHDDLDGNGGRMIRDYAVNICRFTRGVGITNNSARTLSNDDGYKFQNQIMQWILYKKSIIAYLQSIEQDRAGANAQATHFRAVWNYMKKKYNAFHFYRGQREDGSFTTFSDVVVIVNDFTNNTLADIANGIENTFLQFIAPPPIEEPILSLASAAVTTVRG